MKFHSLWRWLRKISVARCAEKRGPRPTEKTRLIVPTLLTMLLLCSVSPADAKDWNLMRDEMINAIKVSAAETGIRIDGRVLDAIRHVERHEFVPDAVRSRAYLNRPLPIGKAQTISQPFIVALMTDLLQVDASHRILELGTGSGYQAAVLAELVSEVYTIEIVKALGTAAAQRLIRLGYTNVKVRIGNGLFGWPEFAPYDGIIITAAGINTPPALIDQLKVGGRLIIPLGQQHQVQRLMVMTKQADGTLKERFVLPVRFVPITGTGG